MSTAIQNLVVGHDSEARSTASTRIGVLHDFPSQVNIAEVRSDGEDRAPFTPAPESIATQNDADGHATEANPSAGPSPGGLVTDDHRMPLKVAAISPAAWKPPVAMQNDLVTQERANEPVIGLGGSGVHLEPLKKATSLVGTPSPPIAQKDRERQMMLSA